MCLAAALFHEFNVFHRMPRLLFQDKVGVYLASFHHNGGVKFAMLSASFNLNQPVLAWKRQIHVESSMSRLSKRAGIYIQSIWKRLAHMYIVCEKNLHQKGIVWRALQEAYLTCSGVDRGSK